MTPLTVPPPFPPAKLSGKLAFAEQRNVQMSQICDFFFFCDLLIAVSADSTDSTFPDNQAFRRINATVFSGSSGIFAVFLLAAMAKAAIHVRRDFYAT